jgi:ferredoxin/flavodoxin
MKIHLVYFSPGGTTKATVRNISRGISEQVKNVEIVEYDMLIKENRQRKFEFDKDDVLVLGMMTLVQPFGPADEIFKAIKGKDTPLIGVVMFGNGMYGNSLKVMKRKVERRGFNMIAASAFIGQMTYDIRVGANRPDQLDVQKQLEFGRNAATKLLAGGQVSLQSKLKIDWPKHFNYHTLKTAFMIFAPLGKLTVPKPFNSLEFNENCIACGMCEKRCPVGAIDLSRKVSDSDICIGCLACVNGCRQKGIAYTSKVMHKAAADCLKFFSERREPELFY